MVSPAISARSIAEQVPEPAPPMVPLADRGTLRAVRPRVPGAGAVRRNHQFKLPDVEID